MQFTPEMYEKICNGDALNNAELRCAIKHFRQVVDVLGRMGPEFRLGLVPCIHRVRELEGYAQARGLKIQEDCDGHS